jgi:tetratricopeptide (TPR) repeat protein
MKFLNLKNPEGKARAFLPYATAFIIVAGIVAMLIVRTTDKGNTNLKPGQLTLSLISDKKYLKSVKSEPQKQKEITLIDAANILRTEIHTITDNKHKDFVPDDFKNVYPVIDFMLAIDSFNGHAIYFKGEIYRLLNDYDRFPEYFQRYLDIEDSIGSSLQMVTDASLCYETPHGYCEQRTAWISQLLANYYYNKGISETDLNKKLSYFDIAMNQIRNVRVHFPAGFKSSKVTISTSELETYLKTNKSLKNEKK